MEKDNLFSSLEKNFITYCDLKDINVDDCGECFSSLSNTNIAYRTQGEFITPSTGKDIFVRQSVVEKLNNAQKYISELFPNCRLEVVYGYRSLDVQNSTYQKIKAEIVQQYPDYDADQINEEVHRFIAVPDVAGHPTGGAVDVQIIGQDGQLIDMGTKAQEFVKESYVFYPLVSKTTWFNRQKLRQAMICAGFSPFDGEWWHFSYGDKEWAKYYSKPNAIYAQVNLDQQGNVI